MVFNAPKQRIDAYLNTEEYLWFFKYCERNYCKNATAGVKSMIENIQNYERLLKKIRTQQEQQKLKNINKDLQKAEVIKK